MEFTIPINNVKIEVVNRKTEIQCPLFSDVFYTLNQDEFSMDVDKVAWFYASGGDYISIFPYPEADENSIGLYLNGSVYGAILHQRKVLPIHGSSFKFNGKGIMICGESGMGKSSVTASFCLNGAEFLSDDITPVIFENRQPCIWAMSDRIKLWRDSLEQLKQREEGLQRIYPETDKFYYHLDQGKNIIFPLDHIFILELCEKPKVKFLELSGSAKFTALRNEIYRYEYLQGMSENEQVYFKQLVDISKEVMIARVFRPAEIAIEKLRAEMIKILNSYSE
jgi:hypothetical protein